MVRYVPIGLRYARDMSACPVTAQRAKNLDSFIVVVLCAIKPLYSNVKSMSHNMYFASIKMC